MTSEEQQLRRKLTGLRISRSHAINALDTANKATAKQIRAKIQQLRVTGRELTARLKQLEEEKAKADDPLRPTQAVLDHHLAAIDSGDMDSILADYHADAVLLTPDGVHRGHDQIKLVEAMGKSKDSVSSLPNCHLVRCRRLAPDPPAPHASRLLQRLRV